VSDPRFVGRSYETEPFTVTQESIRDYMEATGDLRQEAGGVAPPTYAAVYAYDAYGQLFKDQELALNVARLVHGEQRFRFHRPVRAGDRIRTRGRITGISQRGGTELVTFELSAVDAQDHQVCEATALFIIRAE
jgi:acyl dehydratase